MGYKHVVVFFFFFYFLAYIMYILVMVCSCVNVVGNVLFLFKWHEMMWWVKFHPCTDQPVKLENGRCSSYLLSGHVNYQSSS